MPAQGLLSGSHWRRFRPILDLALILLIVGLGLGPRLSAARSYTLPPQAEEELYNRYAVPWSLGQGAEPREQAFPWHPMGSFTHRPPGYALFLGLVYRIAGTENWPAVRLTQAWMGAVALALIYALGILVYGGWAGRAAGLAAALLMARYDFLLLFVARLLSETLYLFLCLSFLSLALLALRRKQPWLSLAAGYVLGWANLTRPFVIFVVPGYLVWLLIAPRLQRRWRHVTLAALGALLAIGPVTWRNWQFHGRLIPISTNGGFTLYNSIVKVEGLSAPEDLPSEASIDARELGELAEQGAFRQAALDYMRRHPEDLPRIFARKFRVLLAAKAGHKVSHELMATPDDPWLYPLALGGALLSLVVRPRWRWHPRLLLLLTIGSQLIVCLVTNTEARYRVPIVPLYALLAAWVLVGPVAGALSRRSVPLPLGEAGA